MYRWSQLFIPTLREAPAEAELASHKFLLRASYIRQLAPGLYSYLFLGQRVLNKIMAIVREEMDKFAQEFSIPMLPPRELLETSVRSSGIAKPFRLQDRQSSAALSLGMSVAGAMSEIARKDLRSYKQLPQIWYQLQPKLPAQVRPKSGLLHARQFLGCDSYSFDSDISGLDVSYRKHYDAYCRIVGRCGLKCVVAEARAMIGSQSQKFVTFSGAGEDLIVTCDQCGYTADSDRATSKLLPVEDLRPEGSGQPELVHTPGITTIEDLARYLTVSAKNTMKTLAYISEEPGSKPGEVERRAVVAFLRGDHQLNEAKLSSAIGGRQFRPMAADEIVQTFGSPAGSLGPIGLHPATHKDGNFGPGVIVLVDTALKGRQNLIAGANRQDYHLKNVTPEGDFQATAYVDLRTVEEGEACPACGAPLRIIAGIEIGRLTKHSSQHSEALGIQVLDRNGRDLPPLIGSYSIRIERLLAAAVEQNHDKDGFWLAAEIAPFEVIVTPISVRDQIAMSAAHEVAHKLEAAGVDVILDDRDERPGVKFKDADLVGIPRRINVGKKVTEGTVEVVDRSTHEIRDASITAITEIFRPSR